jgi:hypothetical protein
LSRYIFAFDLVVGSVLIAIIGWGIGIGSTIADVSNPIQAQPQLFIGWSLLQLLVSLSPLMLDRDRRRLRTSVRLLLNFAILAIYTALGLAGLSLGWAISGFP